MGIGVIIIGDDILSGRRTDKHLPKIIELLDARGLALDWAEYVGDDPARITATLARTFASGDIVFSTGGIGATPDDHTRQCAAKALGVPLELHPEAAELIRARIRDTAAQAGNQAVDLESPENLHRLNMGTFPEGARIIPNSYNKIPGFSFNDHHFVPGFPVMAWPMIEWVLDNHYAHLHHATPHVERSLLVFGLPESRITPLMVSIERDFEGVRAFSLPERRRSGARALYARSHIDLGVNGDPEKADAASGAARRRAGAGRRSGGSTAGGCAVTLLEVIATTVADARAAEDGGANRLKLITAMGEGALTPSMGLIESVVDAVTIPVNVIVRPHSRSFVYDADDYAVMLRECDCHRHVECEWRGG
ncbi:Molybdopterin-binding protein [Candidatus Burkholderia humilis]|nr:Molybdopterin-binding protein [Candidatus Burkholderia humilis]